MTGGPHLGWVVTASSLGSLIEWYDFYLYGSLAVFLAKEFYPADSGGLGLLMSLMTMAIGFAIRPLGGIIFGVLGDTAGRKATFLVTLLLMGASTTCTGLLPTYATVGTLAPILLISLRILQGLAVGGEVGGAMTYVVEHAPEHRRGLYTGILNLMGPSGIILSLVVVFVCRTILGADTFQLWGWRLPFLLSGVLLVLSLYFRLSLRETPLFEMLRETGRLSRSPIRETLFDRSNLKIILISTFGVTAGQAVMGVTSNIYATQYMQAVLHIDLLHATFISAVALLCSLPIYILSGWASDVIGRRKLIVAGMVCASLGYIPIYQAMGTFAAPLNTAALCALCWLQLAFTALIVGPVFAFLTEIFPAKVRTTSVTIPFNIGNGVIGGFAPLVSMWLTQTTGVAYAGLFYPVAVLLVTLIVNIAFVRESFMNSIWQEVATTSAAFTTKKS